MSNRWYINKVGELQYNRDAEGHGQLAQSLGDACQFGTVPRDPTGTGYPTLPSMLHSPLLIGIHQSLTAYSDLYPSKFLTL
jgi:hypothetical protein